ncbi:MAG: hypothetical protein CTY15_04975 [Methylocystis sp.]|nr:MAG: hypothetical protein CTY15_04975 [Methylocystis sp.]
MVAGFPVDAGDCLISFDRLHYGKLAAGEGGRVPAYAGYEVTRRSQGIDPQTERLLSPLRVAGLRRFEPDAIDIDSRGAGCFIARATAGNIILMRTRFRPEDGEGGAGRLHQQSAIWVGSFESWRRNPAACLAVAAQELRADPDHALERDALRLNDAPLRWRVAQPDCAAVARIVERAPWAHAMLRLLVEEAESGADSLLDFGAADFPTEREFLAAVGFALQFLPTAYPRWAEISVASGFAQSLPGLCLRYSPSWRQARAAA